MSHSETKNLQFEPSPEVKAFIFQQIHDLEPMLENIGSMGVFIEKTEIQSLENQNRGKESYSIKMVIAPGGNRIEVRGESDNIYDACIKAKGLMAQVLSPLVNIMKQSSERDGLIHYYSVGGKLH